MLATDPGFVLAMTRTPYDPFLRGVYLDWMEDQGEETYVRWARRHIKYSGSLPDDDGDLVRWFVPRKWSKLGWRESSKFEISIARGRGGSYRSIWLNMGLASGIVCSISEWARAAEELVSRNPITYIVPSHLRSAWQGGDRHFVFCSRAKSGRRVDPAMSHGSVPRDIYQCLQSGEEVRTEDAGLREVFDVTRVYPSDKALRDDVARACLIWARDLVWGDAWKD